jgi:hypothetical protein
MSTPFSKFVKDNIKTEDLVGVEVGVFRGVNTIYLLEDLPIKKLYLVDNYKPYWDGGSNHYSQETMDAYYGDAIMAMEHHFGKTMFIVKDSIVAAKLFPDNYFDFVYIDAGHTYDETMSDMNTWWSKTKSGGVFGGHDYGTVNGAQVKHAVDDFLRNKEIKNENPSIGMRVGEAMEWAIIKP